MELLQDFTASRDKLHKELDDMGPTSRSEDERAGAGDHRRRPRSLARRPQGTQLYDAIFLASDELMKPKDGRKALVVFSDGADRGSKETLNDAIDAADRANVSIYTIYFKGEQERSDERLSGRRAAWRHGRRLAGRRRWLSRRRRWLSWRRWRPEGRRDAPEVDGKKIMEQIATRTGGRFFDTKKKEDLEEIYGLIANELRGQYLLTYTPDKVDNDGGFHKIALKAEQERPDRGHAGRVFRAGRGLEVMQR